MWELIERTRLDSTSRLSYHFASVLSLKYGAENVIVILRNGMVITNPNIIFLESIGSPVSSIYVRSES